MEKKDSFTELRKKNRIQMLTCQLLGVYVQKGDYIDELEGRKRDLDGSIDLEIIRI